MIGVRDARAFPRTARLLALALLFLELCPATRPDAAAGDDARPRLVSLAPSLTEMVFDLGAGNLLAGVTDHCRHPPEALALPKIGGYQNPNFERLLALRPDLVLALAEHAPSLPTLDAIGVKCEVFDHRTLDGLLDSISRLGKICGEEARAAAMRNELEAGFRPAPAAGERPRVLVIFGRDYGQGAIANAYAIGRDGLFETLIAASGARNAYEGRLAYPVLSAEGIAALDPDLIIEAVHTADMGTSLPRESLREDWQALANLRAVKNGRLHYIESDYVYVPGMRMLLLKRDIEAILEKAGPPEGGGS